MINFLFYFRQHYQIVKMKTKNTEKRNCRERGVFMTSTLTDMNTEAERRARREQKRERGLNPVKGTGIKGEREKGKKNSREKIQRDTKINFKSHGWKRDTVC